jgi:enoyl-CoA hydratase
MILSGEPIDARRALEIGLLTESYPPRLYEEAGTIAARLAAGPQAPRAAKEAMMRGADLPLSEALRLEAMIAERMRHGGSA